MAHINHPTLWYNLIPKPTEKTHKYDRGCAVIFAGDKMTGAARLASEACARVGAGLTVVVSPIEAAMIYRISLPPHIIVEDFENIDAHIADPRRTSVLIGPGLGMVQTKEKVLALLRSKKPCVLDADALTVFESNPDELIDALHSDCVLTPHEGEFARIFPGINSGTTIERAVAAAEKCGCVVLLKGHDFVIAAPGHVPRIHEGHAPYLATAGSGDVLAGMITGFLAQGMKPFDATSAAGYIHREAGRGGEGLVSTDLIYLISNIWSRIEDMGS